MAHVLVAALVALLISILAGRPFIDFLRRHSLGQTIREEGPEHHSAKQGTPTMGGVLIVLAATIAFFATSVRTVPALTIFGTTLACGVHRLPRRSDQGPPPPLARALGADQDAAPARDLGGRVHRGAPPAAPALGLRPDRAEVGAARLGLVRARLRHHRRRGQRGEPHRRPRRPRGRHLDHRPLHADRDGGDDLHPLRAARTGSDRQPARCRLHRRGGDRRRDRVPLVQRLPGRGLHGRHRGDGARRRDRPRWRSSCRSSCCSCSSAASS